MSIGIWDIGLMIFLVNTAMVALFVVGRIIKRYVSTHQIVKRK